MSHDAYTAPHLGCIGEPRLEPPERVEALVDPQDAPDDALLREVLEQVQRDLPGEGRQRGKTATVFEHMLAAWGIHRVDVCGRRVSVEAAPVDALRARLVRHLTEEDVEQSELLALLKQYGVVEVPLDDDEWRECLEGSEGG